jgi:hypothetical protein
MTVIITTMTAVITVVFSMVLTMIVTVALITMIARERAEKLSITMNGRASSAARRGARLIISVIGKASY